MPMNPWRWAALASLPFLVIALSFGRIEGLDSCGLAADPIMAFEFVTSPAEVAAQFPAHCRDAAVAAQRQGLWLDIIGFVAAYSALLILVLMALARESAAIRRLAQAGIALVVVAALADQLENRRLLAILASLPGDQATIDQLIPAVRIKFALLGLVEILIGALFLRQDGWRKLAGGVIALGGLASLVGLAVSPGQGLLGGAVAFLAMILSSWVLAFWRGAPR
jgi:hypothetical protein